MKILIVGGGSVGGAICAQLVGEGHDITVVDTDYGVLSELSAACDVFGVVGNGADVAVLRKAGADKTDLLVAVTSEDEINILCCAAAKKLGTGHTIARVRNPEYGELMQLMKQEMNLSLTINPELSVAKEIYRLIRFPYAAKIDTFCRGRVELAEFTVNEDSPLCGVTLYDLRNKLNIRFLVCCVLRDGVAHIPSGYFMMQAGDVICVTAPEEEIIRFFRTIGAYKRPVKDILIVGGGRITYYLEGLLKHGKIHSTVIEKNKVLCRELVENFDCTVVCENGIKQDVLLSEGLEKTDAFLALSEEDEENAIVSMYAKTKHVHKVVTLIGAMSYIDLFREAGLESIVSPQAVTTVNILRYVRSMANVRGSEIESLHRLMENHVEALEFLIKGDIEGFTNVSLKDMKLKSGVLLACIVHGDKVIIPSGNDMVQRGDTVIVVTTEGQIKGIKEILK